MSKTKRIFTIIFNPYSPVITLVLGFLINVVTSTTSDNRPTLIENLYKAENINIIIIILFGWFIASFAYTIVTNKYSNYEQEISALKENLSIKERQIEHNSGIIWNKFGELAKFSKTQKFNEFLKSIVDSNIMVQTAQIYKYSTKIKNNILNIRIQYEEGFAYEGVELNCMSQSYFNIPLDIYKEVAEIIKIWKIIAEEDFESEEIVNCIYSNFENKLDKQISKIIAILDKIETKEQCNDFYAILYRILLLLIDLSFSNFRSGTVIDKVLDKSEIEDQLLLIKRTGILNSILLKDKYLFKHFGISSKNGRIYVVFYFNLYSQDYLLLLTIPPNELSSVENFDWVKELNRLESDLVERMDSIF